MGMHDCTLLPEMWRYMLSAVCRDSRLIIDPFGREAYIWGCITCLTDGAYTVCAVRCRSVSRALTLRWQTSPFADALQAI